MYSYVHSYFCFVCTHQLWVCFRTCKNLALGILYCTALHMVRKDSSVHVWTSCAGNLENFLSIRVTAKLCLDARVNFKKKLPHVLSLLPHHSCTTLVFGGPIFGGNLLPTPPLGNRWQSGTLQYFDTSMHDYCTRTWLHLAYYDYCSHIVIYDYITTMTTPLI